MTVESHKSRCEETAHPTDDELEAMAARLDAMPRPSMLDTLKFCPHEAAAMLRACKRGKPLTFEGCVRIVENTEPADMTKAGDTRWTRRMAEALFNRIEALEPAPSYLEGWNDAREAASKWHDRQAGVAMGSLHCGSENHEYWEANVVADTHKQAAAATRALTPPERPKS